VYGRTQQKGFYEKSLLLGTDCLQRGGIKEGWAGIKEMLFSELPPKLENLFRHIREQGGFGLSKRRHSQDGRGREGRKTR